MASLNIDDARPKKRQSIDVYDDRQRSGCVRIIVNLVDGKDTDFVISKDDAEILQVWLSKVVG